MTVGLLAGAVLLAGCGASASAPQPRAAEPAKAPAPTVSPAGTLVAVGSNPEGVVADAQTHVVAVGVRDPDRLVLLDDRTLKVIKQVPIPGHVRHLQLAGPGGPVLVAAEDSDTFLEVSIPDGTVTRHVAVGTYPHDAAQAADGTVWVADELGGTVSVVRGDTTVATFDQASQPGGVAALGDRVAVIDVKLSTVSVFDSDPPRFAGTLGVGAGLTHLVTAGNRLVAVDTRGDAVYVLAVTPALAVRTSGPVPGTPYGITYDSGRGSVWVTQTALNQVAEVSVTGPQPKVLRTFPTDRQPNTVAVDADTGRVFVASRGNGTLQAIDPDGSSPTP